MTNKTPSVVEVPNQELTNWAKMLFFLLLQTG